jgi:hypothetical protein
MLFPTACQVLRQLLEFKIQMGKLKITLVHLKILIMIQRNEPIQLSLLLKYFTSPSDLICDGRLIEFIQQILINYVDYTSLNVRIAMSDALAEGLEDCESWYVTW